MGTKFNPFTSKARRIAPRTGSVIESATENHFDDATDELNASSKIDAIRAQHAIINALRTGQVDRTNPHLRANQYDMLREASADRTGKSWQILGQRMGEGIYETMDRQGLARHVMQTIETNEGIARVPIHKKDVVGSMATTSGNWTPSVVQNHEVYPEWLNIAVNVHVAEVEIAMASYDMLEESYNKALEQSMVVEDRIAKSLWDANANIANALTLFNTFTPAVFSSVKNLVRNWGLSVTSTIIAVDIWDDIATSTEFSTWFDPMTKRELIMDGELGSILGVQIFTDATRPNTLQVLNAGEVYMFAAPSSTGAIVQREPFRIQATDQYNNGSPTRGWFGWMIEAQTCPNARAQAKAQRI